MIRHQVIVVGGGLAALRAALAAQETADVAVLSMVYPVRSHSGEAQGGINAALANNPDGKDDNWEKHAFDTIKGSDYLADQDAAETLAREAPGCVYEMEHWGVPFSRFEDGTIAQRPFGGAGFPRTCYAADKTGHVLLHTMYEQCVRRGVRFYNERMVVSLVVEDGRCHGVIAMNLITGRLEAYQAEAVVFGTGGAGRVYARTTNAVINTGLPMALAYWAGVPLKDMEFVQFHPTTLYGTNILMTEGARGEGGYLINNQGERFMARYTPKVMELAPRDITSRSIQTEILEGRGFEDEYVYLDLRHLGKEKIMERLPGIRELAINFVGVDPVEKPIPIQPGQHYTMGGIDTNLNGETKVTGFYAAGECACVSVHGANRLGGNSLLETIVFGKLAGQQIARTLAEGGIAASDPKAVQRALDAVESKLARMAAGDGSEKVAQLREEMQQTMFFKVGVFRERGQMMEAVDKVAELQERFPRTGLGHKGMVYNWELMHKLELEGMLTLAEVIAKGALAREESRGSHFRRDFTERDDKNWLKHTLATYSADGPVLSYSPVTITKYEPQARRY
jgi:succinate dehydrogenase / fumarate reductase flavoprotein subunit